jgi:hypothetical protein
MWTVDSANADSRTQRWSGVHGSLGALSFEQVCLSWQSDEAFRSFWIARVKALPFRAYCWECPPVNDSTFSQPFECVFLESPSLARMPPDPGAFAEHFRTGCDVVVFDNLGADALLVAPCPGESGIDYAHLGAFAATAPLDRQAALWRTVGQAVQSRIGPRPLWLSTAGHGVAWLHVRLDSRPKYYRHAAYMEFVGP